MQGNSLRRCFDCGKDPGANYWQAINGWDRPRMGGGTNAIALRKTFDRYLCEPCMSKRKRGMKGQGELL